MTGRGRELADMMERRNVDVLCLPETKWKGIKARNIGGGCKLFYNGADGRKNGIGIVMREELAESVLEVKSVSDRLIAMKLEEKVNTEHSKRVCSTGWQQHGGEKLFLERPGRVDRKCIKTGEDSSRCEPNWTCGRRKHRG